MILIVMMTSNSKIRNALYTNKLLDKSRDRNRTWKRTQEKREENTGSTMERGSVEEGRFIALHF